MKKLTDIVAIEDNTPAPSPNASSVSKETEIAVICKITDFDGLKEAESKIGIEQYQLRPEKGGNKGRGSIRVRRTEIGDNVSYELTIKNKGTDAGIESNSEVNIPVDQVAFEAMGNIAASVSRKERYIFKTAGVKMTLEELTEEEKQALKDKAIQDAADHLEEDINSNEPESEKQEDSALKSELEQVQAETETPSEQENADTSTANPESDPGTPESDAGSDPVVDPVVPADTQDPAGGDEGAAVVPAEGDVVPAPDAEPTEGGEPEVADPTEPAADVAGEVAPDAEGGEGIEPVVGEGSESEPADTPVMPSGPKEIVFPEVVYEVDVFRNEDGSYSDWCRIEVEIDSLTDYVTREYPEARDMKLRLAISALPIKPSNAFIESEADEEQNQILDELYNGVFIVKF